ncbi:hypothetical protein SSP24_03590 [Streptomyces spinoverrucosus]|uniref:Uncharacterized protein n=1 Tax=Streptomyces spinoverrucosus TaxID=284043 RepID=A0A4Y3V798_9ACTN|nr:hypothetical protein [Streptomyces spinoverrucosus]GEC02704.1 hypothetical protein SSP24_03590 [Streptomyces spinoverrucosus]GHB41083.1 hypothetical protein GCM10010397_09010 [Streptomyces spinoverrucosus]
MNQEATMDTAAAARRVRFGKLPERISYEDMTEVVEPGLNGGAKTSPQDTGAWRTFSCLALDLGL